MADFFKELGQSKPGAASLTTLYTVPALKQVVVSNLIACNQSAVATTIRVSVAIAGAADTPAQYKAYDMPIAGNESIELLNGQGLRATDVVRIYNTLATVSFTITGDEMDV